MLHPTISLERRYARMLLLSGALHVVAIGLVPARHFIAHPAPANSRLEVRLAGAHQEAARTPGAPASSPIRTAIRVAESATPPAAEPAVAAADETAQAIGLPVPVEPRYFASAELSEKPRVLKDIPPDLGRVLEARMPGHAVLRLRIGQNGHIDAVLVDDATLSRSDLDRVVQAFREMRFTPGRIGTESVGTEMTIYVDIDRLITLPADPD